jgi:hypothetical protein
MNKSDALQALAARRKLTRWRGYECIGDYHNSAYECDHVSPYTKTAGNVESKVLILLQDWSSHAWLNKPLNKEVQRLGYAPNLPTNKNLSSLLREHFELDLSNIYATNLFPFVKKGSLSNIIHQRHLVRAARRFALPQIEIVNPMLVICLGLVTFNAMRSVCGKLECKSMPSAIESEFTYGDIQFWAQSHPGHFGRVNRNKGGVDLVRSDWQRMKNAFDASLSPTKHSIDKREIV